MPDVRMTYPLDAPPERAWDSWVDVDEFLAWYGPPGVTVGVLAMDVRPGGRRHLTMRAPTANGPMDMWFVGEFTEVSAPHRLVYTESLSNEDGDVLTAADLGMPPQYPDVTTVSVTIEAAPEGSRLTLTHDGVPADSPGATGWQATLNKLADHLA